MPSKAEDKALRYIQSLDEARCFGRWHDVPELARKVEKHAPGRKCLTLTARSEAEIASMKGPTTNPSESSTVLGLVPRLLEALAEEVSYPEDAFQAAICVGWIHWALGGHAVAVQRLPSNFDHVVESLSNGEKTYEGWGKVCLVKGVYIRGQSLEKTKSPVDAIEAYSEIIPYISSFQTLGRQPLPFQIFAEKLLARLCCLCNQAAPSGAAVDPATALIPFRLWSRFFGPKAGSPAAALGADKDSGTQRREVWKAYYQTLTSFLQRNLIYFTVSGDPRSEFNSSREGLSDEFYISARSQQREEIKQVEWIYETMLLQETHFPKADQKNEEVEQWVELLMKNWRIFGGLTWEDESLGQETKASIGADALEMLYRAATKTYHSNPILRHLFTIHASLAEFDLAFKAFDSYMEIVTRAKDRAERSGEADDSIDSDDLILLTASEAIKILCRFGTRQHAEKAKGISFNLEKWIRQQPGAVKTPPGSPGPMSPDSGSHEMSSLTTYALPSTLAIVHRAIGISRAHWARLTFDAPSRSLLHSQAGRSLRRSMNPKYLNPTSLETMFAQGLLLAETRDLSGGIRLMKQALLPHAGPSPGSPPEGSLSDEGGRAHTVPFARERQLISLWHLLALLLTARSEYATASKFCEAAFEQFLNPTNLFGSGDTSPAFKSEHLNKALDSPLERAVRKFSSKGLVDQMSPYEKESIIQIKMTQLTLIETMDGTSAAIDASDELISLFARLFGEAKKEEPALRPNTVTSPPPKSSAGTIKGSIFGRAKSIRKNADGRATTSAAADYGSFKAPTLASRPPTRATATPALQAGISETPPPVSDSADVLRNKSTTSNGKGHRRAQSSGGHSFRLTKRSMSNLRRGSNGGNEDGLARPSTAGTNGAPEAVFGSERSPSTTNGDGRTHMRSPSRVPETPPSLPPLAGMAERGTTATPDSHAGGNSAHHHLRQISHSISSSAQPVHTGHPALSASPSFKSPPGLSGKRAADNNSVIEPALSRPQQQRHKTSLLTELWLFIAALYRRAESYQDAKAAVDEAFKLVKSYELEVGTDESSAKAFESREWGGGKSVDELWADVWTARGDVVKAQEAPHEAMTQYERALAYHPDHAAAIVGLSTILLDIYTENIPMTSPPTLAARVAASSSAPPSITKTASTASTTASYPTLSLSKPSESSDPFTTTTASASLSSSTAPHPPSQQQQSHSPAPTPEQLHRLAARDRAHALLSALTKLESGWDCSEAWFALARAHEESGQLDKAKEVLWWCVELEDTRPLRRWSVVAPGGYVL